MTIVSAGDPQFPSEAISQPDVIPPPRSSLFAGLRIVSACTLASRVLGLLRDRAMAETFGAGPILDAFTVAFQVPNLARQLLGEGALTAAFLPAFVRAREQTGFASARELASATFVRLAQLLCAIVAISEILLGGVLLAFDLNVDVARLLQLLGLFAPYVILVCLTALVCAVLQSLNRFFWPAVLPVLLNLFWLGAVELIPWVSINPEFQIRGIATSLLFAGSIQLLVPILVLHRAGCQWSPSWRSSLPQVRGVFHSMLPVVVGVTLSQLNALIDRVVAWSFSLPAWTESVHSPWWPVLESGTASALYLGQRMYQFPLGVFGVALGTVLFPILTRHAEQGDMRGFRSDLTLGLRLSLAIGLPASVGLMLVAGPLSVALFKGGEFDAADAALTTQMVRAYGSASWAFILLLISNRGFYALHDRQTPVRVGKWAVVWNFGLSAVLIYPLQGSGLAWGTSLATMVQAVWSISLLAKLSGGIHWADARATLIKTIVCCSVMVGVVLLLQMSSWPGENVKLQLGVQCLAGGAAFLVSAWLIGLDEPWMLVKRKLPAQDSDSPE